MLNSKKLPDLFPSGGGITTKLLIRFTGWAHRALSELRFFQKARAYLKQNRLNVTNTVRQLWQTVISPNREGRKTAEELIDHL